MNPTLILHNAKIYTIDPDQPWAEAVACNGGQIAAVGSNAEILALAESDTQLINGQGRLVLPGLTDAHVHFLQYAIRRHQVPLFGLTDFAEARRRIAQAVQQAAPGEWVQGWGWDENLLGISPHTDLLDEISPQNPVALARMDMHTWWTNTPAMILAGVTADTPDPPHSRIDRDESGNPIGLFREWNAIKLIEQQLTAPDAATLQMWLTEAIAEAHQLGLTGIHDQRVEWEGRQNFRLLQALRRQGQLKLRVQMNLAAEYLDEINTLGVQPGFGDERLWLGHIKAFADGSMGSATAYMLAPYEGEPDNVGVVVTAAKEMADHAAKAAAAGFSMTIHAIGDRAIRDVIDVLAEFPVDLSPGSGRLPHRVEHVQVLHPDDIPRLRQHNLVASMQPIHVTTDGFVADKVWGQRARYAYAFRSLLDHDIPLAFGSDAPVTPISPILGIGAAVTRQDSAGQPAGGWYPEERITVAEAIEAYTMGPARLAGKQDQQGSISVGKWADMIVLENNLFEIDPLEIGQTAVTMTVFDGQVVYQN